MSARVPPRVSSTNPPTPMAADWYPMTFMRWGPFQYSPINAVLADEIPVSPIPSRKRQARIAV